MALLTYYLPIRTILNLAWEKSAGSKRTFLIASLLYVAVIFSLFQMEDYLQDYFSDAAYFGLSILSSLINFLFIAGITYLGVRRAYDLPISFPMILQAFKPRMAINIIGLYFLKILINFILAFIALSLLFGILSFIIGMTIIIFIQVRLILALGFVLDKNVGPWMGIKLSFQATRFQFWRLLLLSLIQLCLYLLSIISLGILFIWTVPLTMISYGLVYKNLAEELEKREPKITYKPAKSLLVDFL